MRAVATLDSAAVDFASQLYDNRQALLGGGLGGNGEDDILNSERAQRAEAIFRHAAALLVERVLLGMTREISISSSRCSLVSKFAHFRRSSRELGFINNVGDHKMSTGGLRQGVNRVAQQSPWQAELQRRQPQAMAGRLRLLDEV